MGNILAIFDTVVCFLNEGQQWFSTEWCSELSVQLISFYCIVFDLSFVSNVTYKE